MDNYKVINVVYFNVRKPYYLYVYVSKTKRKTRFIKIY